MFERYNFRRKDNRTLVVVSLSLLLFSTFMYDMKGNRGKGTSNHWPFLNATCQFITFLKGLTKCLNDPFDLNLMFWRVDGLLSFDFFYSWTKWTTAARGLIVHCGPSSVSERETPKKSIICTVHLCSYTLRGLSFKKPFWIWILIQELAYFTSLSLSDDDD